MTRMFEVKARKGPITFNSAFLKKKQHFKLPQGASVINNSFFTKENPDKVMEYFIEEMAKF